MKGSEAGFCLDFGHAVCAANNFKIEPMEFLIKMNKLSPSMYHLTDGTKVQRDWYSSYLLYCINKTYTQINKLKCRSNFATMYQKEKNMIEEIIRSGKKIMNSGIRTV